MDDQQPPASAVPIERRIVATAGGILSRRRGWRVEYAVIHRPSHDDWTLPKGKLEEGESWEAAAEREVLEETGCRARRGDLAGCIAYLSKAVPKIVLFYRMELEQVERQAPFGDQPEVDRMEWLSADEAVERLTYPRERALLAEVAGQRRRVRLPRLWLPREERLRLATAIETFPFEVDELAARHDKPQELPWVKSALELLRMAADALAHSEAEAGWVYLQAARREALLGLTPEEARAEAASLLSEAEGKLEGWRLAAVQQRLQRDGKLSEQIAPVALREAARIRDEHYSNTHRKLRMLRRQIMLLGVVLIATLAVLLISSGLRGLALSDDPKADRGLLLSLVFCFGTLGGVMSALSTAGKRGLSGKVPRTIAENFTGLVRPLVGGAAAVVLCAFLQSGIVQIGTTGQISPAAFVAVAFAAGFSERLVTHAASQIARN